MIKLIGSLIFIFVNAHFLYGQTVNPTEKVFSYGSLQLHKVLETFDDNLLILSTNKLFKLTIQGDIIWSKQLSTSLDTGYYDINRISGNRYIASGKIGNNASLLILNENGETITNQIIVGEVQQKFASAILLPDSTFIVIKLSFVPEGWTKSVSICKLDSNFDEVWNTYIGQAYDTAPYEILLKSDGNIGVSGSESTQNTHPFIGVFDQEGNPVYTEILTNIYGPGTSISEDDFGNLYQTGWDEVVSDDAYFAKLSNSNERIFSRISIDEIIRGYGICAVDSNLIVITGSISNELYIYSATNMGDSLGIIRMNNNHLWQSGIYALSDDENLYIISHQKEFDNSFSNSLIVFPIDSIITGYPKHEMAIRNIVFYPNPSEDDIRIELPQQINDVNYQIKITNLEGQLLIQQQVNCTDGFLDLKVGNLQTGVYILSFESEGEKRVAKLIKR
jgi:hypothetical protein